MGERMNDHARGCEGREYTCTCGYDAAKDAEIERLREVIRDTRSLVSEAAMVGFDYQDGDWPERLFLNQAKLSAALKGGKDHA
jgi:hypothetical protein